METRLALSAVVAVDPAPGAMLTRSPAQFHVEFGTQVADYSLGFSDVVLDQVNADGSLAPAFGDATTPPETLDADGMGLTFVLPAPLAPGQYRLLLSGLGGLADNDGNPISPVDGNDQPIGDFTIARPGVTLADAIDLGPVGPALAPQHAPIAGSLDFTANPSAVDLYEITLPPGPERRVGIEVSAEQIGSPLAASLALFDAQGRPIATGQEGLPDAPDDPFLFEGLKAGTYFIGVAGKGNLPGLAGGYDIVAGTPGPAQTQPGGAYILSIVSEAEAPAQVVAFGVDHADPIDPQPTGFSLEFSAALDLGTSGQGVFDHATGGLQVVDSSGKSWPIAAVNYDEAHASISFLFRDRLPQGSYRIQLDPSRPLTDLAGVPPVSLGLPSGVLATFAVAPDTRARGADGVLPVPADELIATTGGTTAAVVATSEDLGPLTPDLVLAGISRGVTLQPGQSAVFRFVSLADGSYEFHVDHDGGPLAVELDGGNGSTSIDPGPSGQDNSQLTSLAPGVYLLRLTATGDAPVTVTSGIKIGAFGWDSILANGVGQGPALNLRLVTAETPSSFGAGSATTSASSMMSEAPGGPTAGPLSAAVAGLVSVQLPASLGGGGVSLAFPSVAILAHGPSALPFEIGGAPVGRPSLDADHVAAVGPGSEGGSAALASAIGFGQTIPSPSFLLGGFSPDSSPTPRPEPGSPAPITDGSLNPDAPAAIAQVAPGSRPDDAAPASPAEPAIAAVSQVGDVESLASAAPAEMPPLQESEEAASMPSSAMPWAVGIFGVLALTARRIHRRARRRPIVLATSPRIPAPHAARSRVLVDRT